MHILQPRRGLEPAVQVDADAPRDVELPNAPLVAGADAPAEKERKPALVPPQHAPVELTAVATRQPAFSVEKERVAYALVSRSLLQIGRPSYCQALGDVNAGNTLSQRCNGVRCLVSMEL